MAGKSVLFVCLGNICRSPAAEGVLKRIVAGDPSLPVINVESCGIGDWHLGQLPDERMRQAAMARGLNLTSRAKAFAYDYFDRFDYILAADHEVLHMLQKCAQNPSQKAKIHLITAFSPAYKNQEIPDPYYYGYGAFDLVLDMLEDSCEGFIKYLKEVEAEQRS